MNDTVCLNVLANSVENARAIYEATEGHVLIGLLSANYESVDAAVADMKRYDAAIDGAVSVGLGAGDPRQWKMVADICAVYEPAHVNQVFTAVGYTRAAIGNDRPFINALVSPTDEVDYVNVATGELSSSKPVVKADIASAVAMIQEMGGNSIKFFPMNGLATRDQFVEVARVCAVEGLALEPTGGIDLTNFEEILSIALDAGVKQVIPHVYSSIIDKDTGATRVEDVKKLYEMMKKVGK